ncbi:MAG: CvpA family protein [Dehalococcoidia bacterium]
MNLFDWVLIVLFAIGALWGFRAGLVDGVLTVVGIYVALLLSGQFAGRVLGIFTDNVESEALATAIGYVVIFVAVFIATKIVGKIIKTGMNLLLLGWVDKLGGLALGLVAGLLLAGGLTAVSARYAYVVDNSGDNGDAGVIEQAERFLEGTVRNRVDGWLVNSEITSVILDIREALPGGMLGMAPADFNTALDILETRIADKEAMEAADA